MASKQCRSNSAFLRRMREYLSGTAKAWRVDAAGSLGACFVPLELEAGTFYGLDADAMLAITHAIEDLALEEAKGEFLASFQDLRHFDHHRERYWQLAATLDRVTVLGAGPRPNPLPRIRFRKVDRTALARFWIVLYQGRANRVLLLGRQINHASLIPNKRFLGVFTFDATRVAGVRANIDAVLAGRGSSLDEYERLRRAGERRPDSPARKKMNSAKPT